MYSLVVPVSDDSSGDVDDNTNDDVDNNAHNVTTTNKADGKLMK